MNRPKAFFSPASAIRAWIWVGFCVSLLPRCVQASPTPPLRQIPLADARWTRGFWAERQEICRTSTIPALWSIMNGTNHSHFLQNFRIAAGLAEGRRRGASFNDGDFYKWLEAASASLARTNDPRVERWIEESIEIIGKAQRADGCLQTRVLLREKPGAGSTFQNPLDFELYNLGHLFTAACVHHRVTGRTNLLAVAAKAAGFLRESTREPLPEAIRAAICPSHYMGLVELSRETGDNRYLELAKKLFSLRGRFAGGTDDNQDRMPFDQQTNAAGHAVRANYLYAGAADLFLETGDATLWRPLETIWTNVVLEKMYVTGGCGALYDGASPEGAKDQNSITRVHQAYGRNYQLPNLAAHSETCANIGNVLWNWRMFLATGEAKFMEVVELALYNSVLSGMDLSGTNFFYINPLRSLEPMPADLRWPRRRVPFLSSFCCPPNLARTIAEVNGLAFARSAEAIWVNLYGSNALETELSPGHRVVLQQDTEYPWNGKILLTVRQCDADPFALNLRIPGWTKGATLRVNGSQTNLALNPGAYVELRRRWVAGDQVELDLPMPAVLLQANPRVEETLNQVAVRRGPLIYCLETADLPQAQLKARNPATAPAERIPARERDVSIMNIAVPADSDLVARFDRNLLGGVAVIDATGFISKTASWDNQLYRELQPLSPTLTTLRFIPYFAWGNRRSGEMSVWIPLAPTRLKND
jgi:DUF1680 family protein